MLVSLTPFRIPYRDQAFLSFAGLRGAVPIVLTTFAIVSGVPDSNRLLNIVFVLVVIFTLIQGPSLAPLARLLTVTTTDSMREIVVEAAPLDMLDAELLTMTIPPGSRLHAVSILELRLPDPAVITLIIREGHTFVPEPDTQLRTGDEILIVTTRRQRATTERRLRPSADEDRSPTGSTNTATQNDPDNNTAGTGRVSAPPQQAQQVGVLRRETPAQPECRSNQSPVWLDGRSPTGGGPRRTERVTVACALSSDGAMTRSAPGAVEAVVAHAQLCVRQSGDERRLGASAHGDHGAEVTRQTREGRQRIRVGVADLAAPWPRIVAQIVQG